MKLYPNWFTLVRPNDRFVRKVRITLVKRVIFILLCAALFFLWHSNTLSTSMYA